MTREKNHGAALLQDALHHAAGKCGHEPKFYSGSEQLSFAEIDAASDRLARTLVQWKVSPGDRVILGLPNSSAFVIACFAIWKARAVVVPLDPAMRSGNLQHILEKTAPAALICTNRFAERVREIPTVLPFVRVFFLEDAPASSLQGQIPVELLADAVRNQKNTRDLPRGALTDDLACILFTNGSTGVPKGVMHTHASTLACASFTLNALQLSSSDVLAVPLPVHHILAFRRLLTAFLARCSILIATDIFVALTHFPKLRPTGLVMVPAACNLLIDNFPEFFRQNGESLRYLEIGSEPMRPERLAALQNILPNTRILLTYGLTEGRVGYLKRGPNGVYNRVASSNDGLHVLVIDTHGRPVAAGEAGEILLRGAGLFKGYWGDSQKSLETIKNRGFCTGDLGLMEAGGDVQLLGRMDDILKVGGHKINLREVEAVLQRHPAIAEAAIVGLPDPKKIVEAKLHAMIVLQTGNVPTDEELVAHCRKHLEPYKVPSTFHVRTDLPKTPVGKIQRHLVTEDAKRILALEESPALTAECGIQANKKAHVRVSDSI
jgi:long-chain acyl-CoA synthetase